MEVIRDGPRGGVFERITSDGKRDRMVMVWPQTIIEWWEFCPGWHWPCEFICGTLYFRYGADVATIEERHSWILGRQDRPRTYLDLLPTDMMPAGSA